jgi:hypothetical protein
MAELPVNQAATNLIVAIPKLAANAITMAVLDSGLSVSVGKDMRKK